MSNSEAPRSGPTEKASCFLEALSGVVTDRTPVWFMRQAGRYLPEYRKLRAEAGSFLDLCYNPEWAAQVTLQPMQRFDLDAAILFADILLIPDAMGQKLSFVAGEGPRLAPPISPENIDQFRGKKIEEFLAPVFETVGLTRAGLPRDKALIGFAGAPWTVATYMLAGGPSADTAALRRHYYDHPEFVDQLIEMLVEATIGYLTAQIDAGAEALQLFDSWAGGLPEELTRRLSLDPMRRIAEGVKEARPGTPIIFFPRGVGAMASDYAALDACDGISIDTSTPWGWARTNLSPHTTVQGGFDPLLVIAGGGEMQKSAQGLLRAFDDVPYVFNLGHGFTPETPIDHVARLIEIIRGGSA